ncbi:hypothetical protein ACFQVA_31495 [Actinomadura keratinilytica]
MRAPYPEPVALQGLADAVEEPRGVLGAYLDDGGVVGGGGSDADPGRRGGDAAAARVGGVAFGEAGADVERAVEGADQVGAEPGRLREGAVLGGDAPVEQQDAGGVVGGRGGGGRGSPSRPRGRLTPLSSAARTVRRCRASTPATAGSTPIA